jgi:hypothetical protein
MATIVKEKTTQMKEIFQLTETIKKQLNLIVDEMEYMESEKVQKEWVNSLTKIRNDFDYQLGMLGCDTDDL